MPCLFINSIAYYLGIVFLIFLQADLTSSIFSQDSSDTSQPEKSFELLSDLSHLSSLLKLIFIPIKSKMKAIPP